MKPPTAGAATILTVLFLAALFCAAFAPQTTLWAQTSPPAATSSTSAPDVFLITIDTLRADHVGCYGYKQIETPALDALAADGVRFTQAFTHSPITNTSHSSILTGLLPSVHGVTDFGVPLAPQHVTWAELLKKQGYQTAAFIGAIILDSGTLAPGLDRGFDFYDNFPAKTDSKERWGRVERRGMTVVQHAESWLGQHPRGPHAPRFVWVHLFDPHDPYEPPAPFSEKYAKNLYDGEIAYADAALGHFIATIKKSGAYQNAIIVVLGDHGEGLGEHGEETHGLFLYDATLHIPLILKTSGEQHHGSVVDSLVRTTDVLPTVLSLTNTPAPPELNGESMVSLISNSGGAAAARSLFGETDYPLRWGWAPLRAVREQDSKFIEAPKPEFYDLRADPLELKNLYSAQGVPASGNPPAGQQAQLQAEMAQWKAKLPPAPPGSQPNTNLPDPKDKIEVQNLLHKSMLASDDGRTAESRQYLEKAVRIDPESTTALRQLGELEFAAKDYANAGAHLRHALQLRPDDANAAFEAGQALASTGDFAGARDSLEISLKLVPSQISARLLLGRVYLHLNDAHLAQDQFEAALLVDENNTEGRLGLAEAQIMKSEFAHAMPNLEALTKSDATNATAFHLLARAYRGLQREADAKRAEEKAAALEKK